MKSFRSFFAASVVFALVWSCSFVPVVAQAPSPSVMFHVQSVGQGTTPATYSVKLSWQNGVVSSTNPQSESYTIYRAWGFGEKDSEFSLVGTVNMATPANPGKWSFTDNGVKKGVYTYYVRGVAASIEGERSPSYTAVCPSNYCIGPDDKFQFVSTPTTFAMPGERYIYSATSEHPSVRVWGFIRYAMVDGPEGMTIDEKSGELTWDVPKSATGQIKVKITSYMQEYMADTTILYQEWTLRLAEPFEVKQLVSSVKESAVTNTSLYPNPTVNRLHLSFTSESSRADVSIVSMLGITLMSEIRELTDGQNSVDISTMNLPSGSYFVRITSGNKESLIPFVVAR